MEYTVIGYYESTSQAYAEHIEAGDAYEAMHLAASKNEALNDLVLVGAVPGALILTAPCEESGSIAAARDCIF